MIALDLGSHEFGPPLAWACDLQISNLHVNILILQ